MFLKVGTGKGKLSLVQTDLVAERIKHKNAGLRIDRKIIQDSSETDRRRSLFSLEQQGIFDKDVDQAVVEGRVDFAVHNMKDVPFNYRNPRLVIASVPERGSPAEVLVSKDDRRLKDLATGSRIGTSSPIRAAQLRHVRRDLNPEPLFGDLETRIEKVEIGEYDAVILAEAGLARLGMADRIAERLPVDDFLPAPGQGALAVVARRDNQKVVDVLRSIEHEPTRVEVETERELARVVEEPLKIPVGGLATVRGDQILVKACVLSLKGEERLFASRSGLAKESPKLAHEIGEELVAKGSGLIADSWRNARR